MHCYFSNVHIWSLYSSVFLTGIARGGGGGHGVMALQLLVNVFPIAVICVTKSRTGDYDFRACARARGFCGSTFSVGRIRFAVCAERSRDKTCVF